MQQENINDEEEGIDPKKLFDEKNYSTLIINREGFSKKQNSSADLIEGLLEPGHTRAEQEAIFSELKKANAGAMLLDAISETTNMSQKKVLIAACWESGIDFSDSFMFFADLVLSGDFETSLEALTVIEEMENMPSRADVANVLDRIKEAPVANANVAELRNYLNNLERTQ
jgi:hypothetical protein